MITLPYRQPWITTTTLNQDANKFHLTFMINIFSKNPSANPQRYHQNFRVKPRMIFVLYLYDIMLEI